MIEVPKRGLAVIMKILSGEQVDNTRTQCNNLRGPDSGRRIEAGDRHILDARGWFCPKLFILLYPLGLQPFALELSVLSRCACILGKSDRFCDSLNLFNTRSVLIVYSI